MVWLDCQLMKWAPGPGPFPQHSFLVLCLWDWGNGSVQGHRLPKWAGQGTAPLLALRKGIIESQEELPTRRILKSQESGCNCSFQSPAHFYVCSNVNKNEVAFEEHGCGPLY